MADVIFDAFLDSLKILAIVAICTYIIAFIEPLLANKIKLNGKLAPLIGASVSLLPQCGFSVVATDLYQKRHLTIGTLIAVFIATSDEALPVFLSYPDKALDILPILALKFVLALLFGYVIDAIFYKSRKSVNHHIKHCKDEYRIRLMHCDSVELVSQNQCIDACDCDECTNSECSHHAHNHEHKLNKNGILSEYLHLYTLKTKKKENLKRYLLKPLLHSLEIFIYVFVINIIFGIIIYFIGEDKIVNFLQVNKYIAPLLSVIVGAVPNCASSIILSELYIWGGLGFGATLGGLCMNAGIAFMILFKDLKHTKRNLSVFLLMFFISIIIAYIFSLIFNFSTLQIK